MQTQRSSGMNSLWVARGILLLAVMIAACLCPALALGQTNSTWNGGTGNGSMPTDWTPDDAPNNGGGSRYNVTIDSGGTDTVTLDQAVTISSLIIGADTGGNPLHFGEFNGNGREPNPHWGVNGERSGSHLLAQRGQSYSGRRRTLHNNVAVTTTSGPGSRGGAASHASNTASAASLAHLYVCASLPSDLARTMGCR